jgi:hypothetical protein
MSENLSAGITPNLLNFKNQLASLYGADGADDLSPIDQQRVSIYINQAYRECYTPVDGNRPDWAVANYGIYLDEQKDVLAQVVKGSNEVELDRELNPKNIGSYISIAGEFFTIANIEGTKIQVLVPWAQASGELPSTVYHNSYELDREVIDLCDPPEVVGWGRLSPMHGKEQEVQIRATYGHDFSPYAASHYGNLPTIQHRGRDFHVDRPIWYYVDSSDLNVYSDNESRADLNKTSARNRFNVYPIPSEGTQIRIRANILPLELTNDEDTIRLPGNLAWDIMLPIATAKLALSDPRYSGDNREAVKVLADEARERLKTFSSAQKKKPSRLRKRSGW